MRTGLLIAGIAAVLLGQPASNTWSLADKEQFLLTARIESMAFVGKGLTGTRKAILTDGHREHAAHIQSIDIYTPFFRGMDGSSEQEFKDTWKFNVAAYRLAKLLRLTDMVPVAVERECEGAPASFSWWVDNVAMDEHDRISRNLQPPNALRWNEQMEIIRIFDQLIYNVDRSQENLLITSDWQVWMIDHTRAFRKWPVLRKPETVLGCSPDLLRRLEALRREDVAREMGGLLTDEEIDGLIARRDLIVAKVGAAAVAGK
jgi:hypothetical protein